MQSVIHFLRYILGVFFIFSGFVKGIDPKGTAIKMEEYFTVFTEFIPILTPFWELMAEFSLPFSIFMIALEMILGVAFLFGTFFKLSWLLMFGMIAFFTFLTGFTLWTGKVTDCGCFGDFMKLEPYETFSKDVFISILLIILWFGRSALDKMKGVSVNVFFVMVAIITLVLMFTTGYEMQGKMVILAIMAGTGLLYGFIHSMNLNKGFYFIAFSLLSLIFTGFTFKNVLNLPVVDFRAYKVGTDLRDCTSNEGLDPGEVIVKFTMEKGGETKTVDMSEFSKFTADGWTYKDRIDEVIREPELPKCKDFIVVNADGEEIEADILAETGTTLWITSYDPGKGDKAGFERVNELVKAAKKKGIKALGLTTGAEEANELAKGLYEFNSLDAVPIKTMNRSNPGVMVVKDGVLVAKYHHNHLPDVNELPR